MSEKRVYFFSKGDTEGNSSMLDLLGGKGANLAEMTRLGIPVPPGFTISTPACGEFYTQGQSLSPDLREQVLSGLKKVEEQMDKSFGDKDNPLLLSVRSGARKSMPGMMDTILNLGLNDETVLGLAQSSGDSWFAWDSYRRLIQMHSNVVLGMNTSLLEVFLEDLKVEKNYKKDTDLTEEDLQFLVGQFKDSIQASTDHSFPKDPYDQLWGAIGAVFSSWNNPRAQVYRKLHHISEDWGTAVNVQAMVFGNLGSESGTGVAFTRNPSTGQKVFFGEYLMRAQGEDVVSGVRTPQPINKLGQPHHESSQVLCLEEEIPEVYQELVEIYKKLEIHYRDMQDIEFTIERGKLWILQTRSAKRTPRAALKVAVDMMDEKLIDGEEALRRLDPLSLEQLLHPSLDPKAQKVLLTKGLPASPGGVSGKIVFSSEEATEWKNRGEEVLLVRVETSPEDIKGMVASKGILTSRGGMTSHAAVVARGMGKCCVAGCTDLEIDESRQRMALGSRVFSKGEVLTLDGSTGEVFIGRVPSVAPHLDPSFDRIMSLCDGRRRLKIRANADTPKDAQLALNFGAEGIGLCRTEHMFFAPERISIMREMILAQGDKDRDKALEELLPMQREDFYQIFKTMEGRPVTVRLLDPPLHEFLPHEGEGLEELAQSMDLDMDQVKAQMKGLHEFNPMLGHRGCRLAITYPSIYIMQVKAIAEAVVSLHKEGLSIEPEIMIPLVGEARELEVLQTVVRRAMNQVQDRESVFFKYHLGTMIELPRAALTADKIASHADFFSFGTNDLTQTTLGLSRDDSARFLGNYLAQGIYNEDPFACLDQNGVGRLVQMGIDLGRSSKKDLKVGVCGEHGGDPKSIGFLDQMGVDYVSCSPFRLPVARLAAAQATLDQSPLVDRAMDSGPTDVKGKKSVFPVAVVGGGLQKTPTPGMRAESEGKPV